MKFAPEHVLQKGEHSWFSLLGAGGKSGGTSPYTLRRTRDAVDDRMLRQLAGVEPYQATDIRLQPALLQLSEEDLWAMLL